MKIISRNKVGWIYPTKKDIPLDLTGIPQIDISKHLHNYPGSNSYLVGLRIALQSNEEKCSGCRLLDVLFRVSTLEEFLELVDQLQPREWPRVLLEQPLLSTPCRIEIVPTIRSFRKVLRTMQHDIQGQALHTPMGGQETGVHTFHNILSGESVQAVAT